MTNSNKRTVGVGVTAWLFVMSCAVAVQAAGAQSTLEGHDLRVDIDSRWVGCEKGGYCPIRLRVVNRGPTRTLTFRFARTYQQTPVVKQTMEVPQNATVAFSLPVPMVGLATNGELRIEHRGGLLDKMVQSITLPEISTYEPGHAACLVVSPSVIDFQPLDDGVATSRHGMGGAGAAGGHRRSAGVSGALALPASSLPTSWVDYSGVDLVAVPRDELQKLPRTTRTALIQWARCGGTLLVTSVGKNPADQTAVLKLLDADSGAFAKREFLPADTAYRKLMQVTHYDPGSGSVSTTSPPPENPPGVWSRESPPFQTTVVGFGKLVLFCDNPFPGCAQDWYWLLMSVGGSPQWDWGRRIGQSTRMGNTQFLEFLIPGIGGVPVLMFLVLITIFSVVIGPLNYFLLARRKQLHLLLITIPTIALVTSLLLFGYTTVQHGFGVKARARSLTYVDQAAQAAVTFNRLSLYAGQAPSSGVQFSRDTAVLPVWPENESFESGQVDWTETQAMTSGWLRSRTRTQFLTVGHRAERGRLEVTSHGPDKLTVANGFEWGFQTLVVGDDKGRLFVGKNIPDGASAELLPASEEELNAVAGQLRENTPELPAAYSGNRVDPFAWGPRRHYGMYYSVSSPWRFQESQMEQAWLRLQTTKSVSTGFPSTAPVPRSYFGLTMQAPHIEFGVSKVREIGSTHVVMGHW